MAAKSLYGAPVKYFPHTLPEATLWTEINAAIARGDMTTTTSPSTPTGSHDES
jgi:ABC-type uncharacterized transport system YnjBCD ATPase subunit